MTYERKTRDEYEIVTNYGYGWEIEVTEDTVKEARKRKREYLENAKGLVGIYIRKRRVRIK